MTAGTITVLAMLVGAAGCNRDRVQQRPQTKATGWVREPSGVVHRASVVECSVAHVKPPCDEKATQYACHADADCKGGPHPKCVKAHLYSEPGYKGSCFCSYSCATDADCGPGKACVCGDANRGTCAEARCRTDADCAGGTCTLSTIERADQSALVLACHGPKDACRSDADCSSVERCVYVHERERWECRLGRAIY